MAVTKSVLIIGGSGFIGTHLALKLREGYKVFATYHSKKILIPGVTTLPFNVENRNWAKRVLYTAQPDVIIYAAGSNSMEWAEANPRGAERVHTGGAATTANAFDIMQHKFIYLSNCYTFDGIKGNYHENDVLFPVAALGKSKIGGENFIRGKSLNYIILRSSPVFGRSNGLNLSFLDRMRMALDRKERIELPTEEIHSFAPVYGLIDLVHRIIEGGVRNKVLHYGGLTKVSHVDFGKAFARRFGFDPGLVIPRPRAVRAKLQSSSSSDHDFARDFSLNSTVAAELFKIKPYNLEEGFEVLDRQMTLSSRGGA